MQGRDILVQKSPASTIGDLAQGIKELFDADNEIKIIGTRHGEKTFETLLTREEWGVSQDLGNYFRVPADTRDLNYDKYFTKGSEGLTEAVEYTSDNTERLSVPRIKEKLMELDYVRDQLKDWRQG